jgi:putative oxidoreductase
MKYALWIVQGLLALAFLLAGLMKLTQPMDVLAASMGWPVALPALLVRFIGLAELLGAIGLILPALTRIRPGLVPLAAAGLTLIILLATLFHVSRGEGAMTPVNLVLGALAAFVAYGRGRLLPHGGSARRQMGASSA